MNRPRLSPGSVPAGVAPLGYARDRATSGIVHLGIGAFHRAHQAVYTDDALAAGDAGWGITAVSLRSPSTRDALMPQDCLYMVEERSAAGPARRLIGAINTVLVAPEAPERVIAALADPAVHIVTLTVTEKGYYREPAGDGLLFDDPAIVHDLSGAAPRTIFGYLAAALDRRQAEGAGPLTLLSCDNLSGNGDLLDRLLGAFLARRGRPVERRWTCPNTMVDRIVPRTTAADRDGAPVDDHGLVVTEPFRQWVIEDRFAGPRPRWEVGGAQIVADVHPFELAKLRLLNGSHSTLAYVGLLLGHTYVHQAVADPALAALLRRQIEDEAMPTLAPAAGLDYGAYADALLRRFDNPALPHRLDQIASDGSQKIPQRWLAAMVERDARGLASPAYLLALAAWIVHVGGAAGRPVDDPLAGRLAAIWRVMSGDPRAVAAAMVSESGVFPDAFRNSATLPAALAATLTRLMDGDPRGLIAAITAPAPID
ncbi:mannitol dehydrogenase family protein [Sphingomonas flavalba]|uniref:mannitol dehydrogenase family protein n=1 Tax=Sphingomonas flavalba TaxID=2559804 RepID=UPI001EF0764B|nr:mannitol dehydrogenase family protein [Sphingomonas flavalba]